MLDLTTHVQAVKQERQNKHISFRSKRKSEKIKHALCTRPRSFLSVNHQNPLKGGKKMKNTSVLDKIGSSMWELPISVFYGRVMEDEGKIKLFFTLPPHPITLHMLMACRVLRVLHTI